MFEIRRSWRVVPCVVVGFLLAFASPGFSELKIGYINSEKLAAEYEDFAEAEEELYKLKEQLEQRAAEKESELKKMQSDFERQRLLLSEIKKKEMEKEIETTYRDLQRMASELVSPEGELSRKSAELWKPIYEKLNGLIHKIGEEDGYDFIFDGAAPGVVFAKEKYDLTQRVLDELRKEETETQ